MTQTILDLDDLKIHPACMDWPEMSDQQFVEMCQSMKLDGFYREHPIVKYGHFLIDGRSRRKAAKQTGTQPVVTEFKPFSDEAVEIEKEIYRFVWASNGDARRHMSTAARVEIGMKWIAQGWLPADIELPAVRPGKTVPKQQTQKAVAEKLDISVRTMQMGEYIANHAQPEVQKLLRDDRISQRTADKLAHLAPDVQRFVTKKFEGGTDMKEAIALGKADEAERKKPPVIDATGTRVPDQYKAIFEARDKFRSWSAQLKKIGDEVQLVAAQDAGARLEVNVIVDTDLKNAARRIRQASPHAICVYCKGTKKQAGEKCQGCRGRGWLVQAEYDQAPPELRKVAG